MEGSVMQFVTAQIAGFNIQNPTLETNLRRLTYAAIRILFPWRENGAQLACAKCGHWFNFFRRRHHCRICGEIFCSGCSTKRKEIPKFIGTVRVCDSCNETYFGIENHQLPTSCLKTIQCGPLLIPGLWMPHCACCAKVFNWNRRRKHCHKCGQVACGSCTKGRKPIHEYGFTQPVRVCRRCMQLDQNGPMDRNQQWNQSTESTTV